MMSGAGLYLIPLVFAACFGLLAYAFARAAREGLDAYDEVYSAEASRQFEDLFLFIPPRRIAELARVTAVLMFILCYLAFGGFGDAGAALAGGLFGSAGAGLALAAPRILIRVLRARRIKKFNEQLVDSLVGMSSALKAGFSILQAFETVVKQGLNQISQEFSLFLQQMRIGVKFEEALRNMEERVGSDDLLLMNQSIEIARQTGGNLTEVFEKIASVIRERMRIQQRIRSLTAQGRLQGIVVGSVPALLLFAMTLIDPQMMMPFFRSAMGISVLAVVVILEVCGALVIRKIVAIKV